MDPAKRPTAFEALSHYWILNRFMDLQADNLLMNDGTEENENTEFEVLTVAQSNMANYKYFLITFFINSKKKLFLKTQFSFIFNKSFIFTRNQQPETN